MQETEKQETGHQGSYRIIPQKKIQEERVGPKRCGDGRRLLHEKRRHSIRAYSQGSLYFLGISLRSLECLQLPLELGSCHRHSSFFS